MKFLPILQVWKFWQNRQRRKSGFRYQGMHVVSMFLLPADDSHFRMATTRNCILQPGVCSNYQSNWLVTEDRDEISRLNYVWQWIDIQKESKNGSHILWDPHLQHHLCIQLSLERCGWQIFSCWILQSYPIWVTRSHLYPQKTILCLVRVETLDT